ncbi:MAG TPA: metallophosphoesterase [Feifaniaceae bacterium]|nr:metallophosphoesterase [Feifaniaceae bacterium]
MRDYALIAMVTGAFYLWPHFKGLLIFKKAQPGVAWLLSAILTALLLLGTALFQSVVVGFFLYLCMFYVITDLVFLALHLFARGKEHTVWRRVYCGGVLPIAAALLICVFGILNAKNIVVTEYEVTLNKPLPSAVRVALVSDMHLGTSVHEEDLPGIVNQVNALSPNLILLGGDIYEERTTQDALAASYTAFSGLHAPLGVYYVPGNHEYRAQRDGTLDLVSMFENLEAAGITPLKDEAVDLTGLYLVGRDDFDSFTRAKLATLLEDVDQTLPVVVLDHQPMELREAKDAGVDLQLSGHTHAGQLFPGGLLTELFGIFEYSYGYHRDGNFQIIVSSGIGAWGFPMRVGSPTEIVLITLKGKLP